MISVGTDNVKIPRIAVRTVLDKYLMNQLRISFGKTCSSAPQQFRNHAYFRLKNPFVIVLLQ